MRKLVIVLIVFNLLLSLSSCVVNRNPPVEGGANTDPDICDTLNVLAEKEYDKITLSVKALKSGVELLSEYTVTDEAVEYSIERLNRVTSESIASGVGYKTTVTGILNIENGEIVKGDGDEILIPDEIDLGGKFSFKKGNFKNISTEDGTFECDVISPSDFLGGGGEIEGMHLRVGYTDDKIGAIVITYTHDGTEVTLEYIFEIFPG